MLYPGPCVRPLGDLAALRTLDHHIICFRNQLPQVSLYMNIGLLEHKNIQIISSITQVRIRFEKYISQIAGI